MPDKFEWIMQLGTASKEAQLDFKGVHYNSRRLSEKKQETADNTTVENCEPRYLNFLQWLEINKYIFSILVSQGHSNTIC
jgi:hypothetical protein